jgi:hypothetical protein
VVVMTIRKLTIGVQILVAAVLLVLIGFTLNHDFIHPPAGLPCTTDSEPLFHGLVDRMWYLVAVPLALLVGRYSHPKGKPPPHTEQALTSGELSEPGETESAASEIDFAVAAPPAPPGALAAAQLGSEESLQGEGVRLGSKLASRAIAVGHEGLRLSRANIVQLVLTLFIGVAVVGLFYETIQVYRDKPHWPLTFFIRCLNEGSPAVPNMSLTDLTSVPTFITVIVVAVVLGSWLWVPRPTRQE